MWADFQPQSKGLCVKIYSAEPDLNQWPRDGFYSTTVSRSANWAIGGTHLRNSEWTQGINISYCKQIVNAKKRSLRAGFEPAREDPIGFQVQRLNHSATTAQSHWMLKKLEMRGIEPRAFHMQSERSTTELHPRLQLKLPKMGIKKVYPRGDSNPQSSV